MMEGSYGDENDYSFERQPLLPQHAEVRSRRRSRNGGASLNNVNNNIDADFDDDSRNASGKFNGSPTLDKIKSIPRIGRSCSLSIAEESVYYYDDTNDYSWEYTFGTEEGKGVWLNTDDFPGTVMSVAVWILIIYSAITITLLAESNHLPNILAYVQCTICAMALSCHAKTMFSDPGAVPREAIPIDSAARQSDAHAMCRVCNTFKPPNSHHCRLCNRCISRMDHHCPWTNNCIGAANMKPFILFLSYTWIGSAFSLIIFGCNYFFCNTESCEYSGVLMQLVRGMTVVCAGSILFVSSMLANVTFAMMSGQGTIDRLKRRIASTSDDSDEEPVSIEDIFGTGSYWTWCIPIDPIFPDSDRVLCYSMPQRLLREGNENTSIC